MEWQHTFSGQDIGSQTDNGLKVIVTGGELKDYSFYSTSIAELELHDVVLKDDVKPFYNTYYKKDGKSGDLKVTVDGGSIGKNAFSHCYVTNLTCKNTKIGDYAFRGYDFGDTKGYFTWLEELTLENVSSIGQQAFAYDIYLTSISLTNVTIDDQTNVFYSAGGYGTKPLEVTVDGGSLGTHAFRNCKMQTLNLQNVDTVGRYMCYTCPNLTTVTGLNAVSSISTTAPSPLA